MKAATTALFALTCCLGSLGSQDAPASAAANQESARLVLIGAASGQAVYATFMGINCLSDGWAKEVYTDELALTIAGSLKGGLGAMNDNIPAVIEGGLNDADREAIGNLAECGRLVDEQINAFFALVKDRSPQNAEAFEASRIAAQQRVFATLGIEDGAVEETSATPAPGPAPKAAGASPNRLEFEIVEGIMPDGKEGQKGKAVFSRTAEDKVYSVDWTYTDGTSDSGLAIAFPGSGRIAVGFGPDVLGIAIYKMQGKSVDGRWAPYTKNSEISPLTMERGENESIYRYDAGEGASTFHFEELENDTARLEWRSPSGDLVGYGVYEGDYLAAVSVKPGGQSGVAIYTAEPANNRATGKWTLETTLGAIGRETYKFLKAE